MSRTVTVWLAEYWDDPFLSPTTESVWANLQDAKAHVESWAGEDAEVCWDRDFPGSDQVAVGPRVPNEPRALFGRIRQMEVKGSK